MKKGLSVWPALSTVAYGVFSALFYAFGVHADDDIQFDSNFCASPILKTLISRLI